MHARTRTLVFVLLIAGILSALAIAQTRKSGSGQRFAGTITDNMCGEKHTMIPGKSDAECVRECVKSGAKFALLSGSGHVYILEGKSSELDNLAAQKVIINGRLNGNTIEVTSVVAAK